MARTTIARFLKQLAREHAVSAKSGVALEQIREGAGTSRRELLQGAALALAGTAVACNSALDFGQVTRQPLRSGPRIAIIGGGIAGLTTALTLADAGYASTIYEALPNRVGGRMMSERSDRFACGSCHGVSRPVTATWAEDQVTDVFGEMIDSGHRTMRGLAQRYRLTLVDSLGAEPAGSTATHWFGGGYYTTAELDADYRAIEPAIRADLHDAGYPTTFEAGTPEGRALDAMSIYDWIESRVPGGHSSRLGQLLDAAYVIEYGADTPDQSALNLLYLLAYNPGRVFHEYGVSDERFRVYGGIEEIPRAIAADLTATGIEIKLGHWLESIALRSDGTYDLTISSGSEGSASVAADVVVLAIPFSVLRDLDYSEAGFDALKQRAIAELGAAHNGKLQLQFGSRYWNGSGPWGIGNGSGFGEGYQCTWEPTRGFPGTSGILVNYTGGSVTDAMRTRHAYSTASSSSVLADAATFLGQIEPVFPGITAAWNGRAAAAVPHKASVFKCSYSYWKPGQYQTIAGYERVRQGNVFFAGEHTSVDYQGYMEGGASEGARAAKEIIHSLRGPVAWRAPTRAAAYARG